MKNAGHSKRYIEHRYIYIVAPYIYS